MDEYVNKQPSAIVAATPKLALSTILAQSNDILYLKLEMKNGVHFGPPYPGSDKPTLLKPGAEWLAKRFGLRPHFEQLDQRIELDPAQPWMSFVMYRYRCLMIDIETGAICGEAIGSCNSWEDKYHWRWVEERNVPSNMDRSKLLTKSGKLVEFTFAVEKPETTGKYGKPMEYWKQFQDAIADGTARKIQRDTKNGKRDAWEIGGTLYRIPADNPLDQINTYDKMAQKRSFVSAVLIATGSSPYFAPGDDSVSDMYVTEPDDDDKGYVDAEFVVVEPGGSVPSNAPSAKVKGAGQPAKPAPAKAPPPETPESSPAWWEVSSNKDTFLKTMIEMGIVKTVFEAEPELLKLTQCADWKAFASQHATGKAALTALKATFETAMKANPAPSAKSSVWTDALRQAITAFCTTRYEITPGDLLKRLKKDDWTAFESLEAAESAVFELACREELPFVTTTLEYKVVGKGKAVVFVGPRNLHVTLFGGREALVKALGKDGTRFKTDHEMDAWETGKQYKDLRAIRVNWHYEVKTIGSGEQAREDLYETFTSAELVEPYATMESLVEEPIDPAYDTEKIPF